MTKTEEGKLRRQLELYKKLRKKDEKNYNELKMEVTKMKKEIIRQLNIVLYNINDIMYVGDKQWNRGRIGGNKDGK